MKNSSRAPRTRHGTALIVVLMFVVLMTVVVLAFFMKATAFRGLSQSAVNEFKADTLARSALAVTVSDLRQEIEDGSDKVNVGGASAFLPKSNYAMAPARSGNPPLNADGTDPIPNLVRRSVRSDPIVSPGVSSRASASSSSLPSGNGRYIGAARWNKHYLIPRDPALFGGANAGKVGSDPVPAFVPPDWVYVTENGPEVLMASKRSVIGRYAFAVFDEGGLLDINVAGFPSNTPVEANHPTPNPHSLVNWGSGAKGATAFADLKVIGLTPHDIDQIVGWRAYASSQPTGSFPNLVFNSAAAARFHDLAMYHPSASLLAPETTWVAGGISRTDQMFTSRQQLIQFGKLLGFSQDALQYLGTFSRTLEQPGCLPETSRPRVKSNAATNNNPYGRGNDAYNRDRESDPAIDINPPFPLVRVKTAFTRPDGSAAEVGDVLVKHRFPLARLKQILETSTASKDSSDPIYRDFGIYRSGPSQPWTYDHGDSSGIMRLDEVSQAGREPDFFELLQAAIQIGSLGKAAPVSGFNVTGGFANIVFSNASSTPLHLLQIGANIIDQNDEDGFPTRIQIQASGGGTREVSGVEDLPYLYVVRNRPSFPSFSVVRWLMQPVVWNPHDSSGRPPTNAPTTFRIRAELQDPAQEAQGAVSFLDGQTIAIPNASSPVINFKWADAGNEIIFRAGEFGGFPGFRQPTRLGEANVPAGSQAAGNTFAQANVDTTVNLIGIVATEFPVKWPKLSDPAQYTYASQVQFFSGPAPGINFILEYQQGSSWIEYDSFPYSWTPTNYKPKIYGSGVNTDAKAIAELSSHYSNRNGRNMIDVGYNNGVHDASFMGMIRTDPRAGRWAPTFAEYINWVPDLDVTQNTYQTFRGGTDVGYGTHHTQISAAVDRGFVGGDNTGYPGGTTWGGYRGFQHGYWAENSTRATRQDPIGGAELRRFNRDPDGVPRRAMGGYASDPASGGSLNTLEGLPLATNNFSSRPVVLNRPFQSVAELGYVFRGEPWKNLSFSFPESGDAALLDVFCLEEPVNEDSLVAGRVNLNTRQAPVLQALLAGTTVDATDSTTVLAEVEAKQIAEALVARTMDSDPTDRKGPLKSRGDLVGRWAPDATKDLAADPDPENHYSGFSSDLGAVAALAGTAKALIPRQREAAIRALSQNGTARTWNLLIDVVAQAGSFPTDGGVLEKFQVTGEKRYWLHVAIDRFSGEVVDQQLELVTE